MNKELCKKQKQNKTKNNQQFINRAKNTCTYKETGKKNKKTKKNKTKNKTKNNKIT